MVTEVIFQHGWAFDSNCWREWVPAFGDARVLLGERGYFGARKSTPVFSEAATRKIAIVHSFGAHLLAPQVLSDCDTLILIASFIDMKKNARAIKAMLNKFSTAPDQVVLDFWTNCYAPELGGISLLQPPGLNENALEDDLTVMLDSTLDCAAISAIPNVVLVNCAADRIVPRGAHAALQAAFPAAKAVRVDGASHALPLMQPSKCIQLVSHWTPRNQLQPCQPQKL